METKVDQSYRWRGMKIKLPLWLLSIGLFFGIFLGESLFWVCCPGFIISCIAGIGLEIYLRRTYRCPTCGSQLAKPIVEGEGNEYIYYCDNCQIRWRTLTYVASSGG
jgi:hypothetical protein